MTATVLVDTGPLVAILLAHDPHHDECVKQLSRLAPPLLTCWPVLTETAWLLRHRPDAVERLFANFESGLLELLLLQKTALPWISRFLRRYRTLGAQLADAALVYLAEREGIDTVFTLDHRDFSIYRLSRNRHLKLLPY